MTRDDLAVHRKCRVGDRAVPDFVIALALPDEIAFPLRGECAARRGRGPPRLCDISSVCSTVRSSCQLMMIETSRGAWAQHPWRMDRSQNSENSKANRIETMKGPAESGQICSVGRRKI